jgi:hypothetical protein
VEVGVAAVVVVSTLCNHPVSRSSQQQCAVIRCGCIVFASLCCYNAVKTYKLLKHILVETKTNKKKQEKKNIPGA